ncbi:MAG: hypothetical protein KCHDKBKB_01229 [Elusimicrobia bacterium]|nr:hypothetical protein [Elusimicrobiota bacterium]
MTWLDITLVVVLLVFIALGARVGSIWMGVCLMGGFFGAFLVEYYALPAAEWMGGFSGAKLLASVLLFVGGVTIALVPGWVISRLVSAVFLGVFDSVAGLLTGALAGLVCVSLVFFFLIPHFPQIEKGKVWKRSKLVRPLYHAIEDFFNDTRFRRGSTTDQLTDEFMKDVTPVLEKTGKKIGSTLKNIKK